MDSALLSLVFHAGIVPVTRMKVKKEIRNQEAQLIGLTLKISKNKWCGRVAPHGSCNKIQSLGLTAAKQRALM
jgi:hypothetical protein